MLQDIYPHQLKNNYTRCTPDADSLVFIYADGHFLLSPFKEPEASLPTYTELPDQLKVKTMQYLFMIADKAVFSLTLNKADFLSIGWKDCPVTATIRNSPVWMPLVIITAFHLVHWYENHKFCGRCGGVLVHSIKERALECPECRITEYPKIAPVVIVAVVYEGKLLMIHYVDRNIKPFVLIAGFWEPALGAVRLISNRLFCHSRV